MADFIDYTRKVNLDAPQSNGNGVNGTGLSRRPSGRSTKSSKSKKGAGDQELTDDGRPPIRPKSTSRHSSTNRLEGAGIRQSGGHGTNGNVDGEKDGDDAEEEAEEPLGLERKKSSRKAASGAPSNGFNEKPIIMSSVVRDSDPIIDYGAMMAARKEKGLPSLSSLNSERRDEKSSKAASTSRRASVTSKTTRARGETDLIEAADAGKVEDDSPTIPSPTMTKRHPSSSSRRSASRNGRNKPQVDLTEEDDDEHEKEDKKAPLKPILQQRPSEKRSISRPDTSRDSTQLTPQDRHYLNKALVYIEMQREWSLLSGIGTLASYGSPFLPHPNGPNSRPLHLDKGKGGLLGGVFGGGKMKRQDGWEDYEWQPAGGESEVLGYMYWRFVYNFPALRLAKPVYWTDQIQPLFDSFAERDLSTTRERSEVTKRRLLSMGLTRILGTYYGTCMRSLRPSAPARPSLKIMRRVDFLFPGAMTSMWKTWFPRDPIGYNAFSSIVGTEGAEDFLIFSQVIVVESKPMFLVSRSWSKFKKLAATLDELDPENKLDLPLLPPPLSDGSPAESTRLQTYLRWLIIALSTPPESELDSTRLTDARAKLEQFLLDKPLRESKSDLQIYLRQAKDSDAALEEKRAPWIKMGERAKELRTTWVLYKRALIEGDEVDKSMALVRKTPLMTNLPVSHRDAQYWAAIWVSYALHYLFVTSPTAGELTHLLKSFHDLVPYAALKLGLTLVNPTLAIRAVVAIVLGQPGGTPSLFQRIFGIVLGSGLKQQKKIIAALQLKLGNEVLCNAIESHVYAPFAQRAGTRTSAEHAEEDIVLTIVRDYASSADFKLVSGWQKDFIHRAMSGKSTEVHQEDESAAGRYQCLKSLLRAQCLKRDREQVLELVMERNTPQMMHESIAVFYNAIYQIANAANLAARLGDLQAFLGDLIEVAMSDNKSPADFIKLSRRHDQNLYFFIHELASNGGPELMEPIIEWSKSGLSFIRDGVPPVQGSSKRSSSKNRAESAPQRSNRAGVDYDELLNKVSPKTRTAVLEEVRGLALYSTYKKAWADICLRADLLEMETGEKIDKARLYSDLLSQDSSVLSYLQERGGYNPDENIEWAWYAEDDALNDPASIKLDWATAERAEKAAADARKRSKPSLFRKSSRTSSQSRAGSEDENGPVVTKVTVPPPRIVATRALLKDYCETNRPSLVAARKAELK